MDIKMIVFLVYAFFVIQFMFIDALTTIAAKKRFHFWQTFWLSVFFPLTAPFVVIMAKEITRDNPDE